MCISGTQAFRTWLYTKSTKNPAQNVISKLKNTSASLVESSVNQCGALYR